MQRTVLEGIAMWSQWQPDRNLFFNSFFVALPGGNVAIDPLPVTDGDASEIAARGGLAWVLVTNRDHERDARALAERFGASLACAEREAELLAGPVARTLRPGDAFAGATVFGLDGVKTPGEIALFWEARGVLLVGDALWGSPAGAVRLMPDDKLEDPARAVLSLRALFALRPRHLLVGDGTCIFGDAERAIWTCLEARSEVYVNRINRDDAVWHSWENGHAGFGGASFEIGDHIGAQKLGYRLISLPPGLASAPLHWHACEEELFIVMRGAPTLLTPRGEVRLREGDYVSFRTQPAGAHKLVNRGDAPCEVFALANVDPSDVCYYPDSRKVLVERSDVLVRDNPILDYWEGEA